MAELYFKIGADYEKVIRLREEIARLEGQLKSLGGNAPSEFISGLSNAKAELRAITSEAAKTGASVSRSFDSNPIFKMNSGLQQQKGLWSGLASAVKNYASQFTAAALAYKGVFLAISSIKQAVDTIVDFQLQNSMLQAILGTTKESMENLIQSAKDLGRTTVFTASQVTQLQIELSKLGFKERDILNMSESVLQFAQATGAQLGDAAATTGAVVRMFGASTEEAGRYTAAMAAATTNSALNFQAIADNMATFGPLAHSMGLEVEDVLALFGKLKDAGIDGSTAMTSLRNIFTKIAQGKVDGMGSFRNLEDFVSQLQRVNDQFQGQKGASAAIKQIGNRGGTQFITLMRAAVDEENGILALKKRITDAEGGALGSMSETMTSNVSGQMRMLSSAWEGLVLQFESSTGPMAGVLKLLTDGINAVSDVIEGKASPAVSLLVGGIAYLTTTVLVAKGVMSAQDALVRRQTVNYAALEARIAADTAGMKANISAELQSKVAKGQLSLEQAKQITLLGQKIEADRKAALAELELARAEEASVISMQESTMAEMESVQSKLADAEAGKINLTQEEMNTLAKKKETLAEDMQTAAEMRSTASKEVNTAQTKVNTQAQYSEAFAKGVNTKATTTLKGAMDMLGLSMLKNPAFWLAAAFVAVGAAVYSYCTSLNSAESAQEAVNKQMENCAKRSDEQKSKVSELTSVLEDQNATLKEQYQAWLELKNMFDILGRYTLDEFMNLDKDERSRIISRARLTQNEDYNKRMVEADKELAEYWRNVDDTIGYRKLDTGVNNLLGENWESVEDSVKRIYEKYHLTEEDAQAFIDSFSMWNSVHDTFFAKVKEDAKITHDDLVTKLGSVFLDVNRQWSKDNSISDTMRDAMSATRSMLKELDRFSTKKDGLVDINQESSRYFIWMETLKKQYEKAGDAVADLVKKQKEARTTDEKQKIQVEIEAAEKDQNFISAVMNAISSGQPISEDLILQMETTVSPTPDVEFQEELGASYDKVYDEADVFLGKLADKIKECENAGMDARKTSEEVTKSLGEDYKTFSENADTEIAKAEKRVQDLDAAIKKAKEKNKDNRIILEFEAKKDAAVEALNDLKAKKQNVAAIFRQPMTTSLQMVLSGYLKDDKSRMALATLILNNKNFRNILKMLGLDVDNLMAGKKFTAVKSAGGTVEPEKEEEDPKEKAKREKEEAERKRKEEAERKKAAAEEKRRQAEEKRRQAAAERDAKKAQRYNEDAERLELGAKRDDEDAAYEAEKIRLEHIKENGPSAKSRMDAASDLLSLELDNQLRQIDRERDDLLRQRQRDAQKSGVSASLTENEERAFEQRRIKANNDFTAEFNKLDYESKKSQFDYFSKYGDYGEKMAAALDEALARYKSTTDEFERKSILAEYDESLKADVEKIHDLFAELAGGEGAAYVMERRYEQDRPFLSPSEQAEREHELTTATAGARNGEFLRSFDWVDAFGGITPKKVVDEMMGVLRSYTYSGDFSNLDDESRQNVFDVMRRLEESTGYGGDMGYKDLAIDLSELDKAVRDSAVATEMYQQSMPGVIEQMRQAENNLALAKENLANAIASGDANQIDMAKQGVNAASADMAKANAEAKRLNDEKVRSDRNLISAQTRYKNTMEKTIHPVSSITSFLSQTGVPQLGELFHAFDELKGGIAGLKALKELGKNTADVAEGIKGVSDKTSEAASKAAEGAGKAAGEVAGKLSQGLSKAGFIGQIISAILSILDILKDGIGTLIRGLLETVGNAIGGLLNEIASGKILDNIIKGVKSIFSGLFGGIGKIFGGGHSLFSNADKVQKTIDRNTERNELLQKSVDSLKDSMDKARGAEAVAMANQSREYIKEMTDNYLENAQAQASYHSAHHSFNYYWEGFSQEQVSRLSKMIGRDWDGDLWSLSPEEMKVLQGNADMWDQIRNTGKGKYGERVADQLQNYIDMAGKLDEVTDRLRESLTSITFDSLRENFISTLMDMDADAEEFSDKFSEYLMKAMLDTKVSELLEKDLENFYKDWASMSENGLTGGEIADLNDRYNAIVERGLALRDEVAEITGYDQNTNASGTSRGVSAMTQDVAEELNGRFTALQIAGEGIRGNTLLTATSLISLDMMAREMFPLFYTMGDDIRRMQAAAYIELQQINERQEVWNKPILQMASDISDMRTKLNTL